mmetsp:Transcript_33040/g.83348  ORF Transcript_33040/g.83348 Transcript_33040/m.83348 type:complete len:319 (+) Transcript_33040:515-1471(+)
MVGSFGRWPWELRRRCVSTSNGTTPARAEGGAAANDVLAAQRRAASCSTVERNRRCLHECYYLEEIVGCGAFAVVQRAVCKETGTAWAVKKFNAGTSRDAILKEIHILSQLDHANVLRPREYFDDDAGVALITELLVGEHLLECVADRGSYAEDDCRQIARNVLSALAHCHAKGVVHRDLKLENLVLSCNLDPCSIKIVDFGLSGQLLESEPFLTESCGTPACTAPEVLQRNASYGSSPDVWSVGCLIFTLLSGAPPFQARVLKSLVRDIRQGAFSMQDPAWELVSDSAKEFVKLLLQVEPKKRPTALAALEHSWLQE